MDNVRTFARSLDPLQVAIVLLVAVNLMQSIPVILSVETWSWMDWHLFEEAGARIARGDNPHWPPDSGMSFRWSPAIAWLLALMAPLGPWGWTALGLAPLLLLRDWRFVAAFLVAVPFWRDVESGISFAYVPILAIAAVRGSFTGGMGIAALTILVPRPMMLLLAGYFLWKRPAWRAPMLAVMAACLAASVATGWADEWFAHLLTVADAGEHWFMFARTLGPLWLAMIPLSAWLTWKGYIGLAALAISPYWTFAYPLMLLVDVANPDARLAPSLERDPDDTKLALPLAHGRAMSGGHVE